MEMNLSETLQAVYDVSLDAILVADHQGKILMTNHQVEEIFGYEKSELIGKPVEILIPTRFAKSHEEYRSIYASSPTPRKMNSGYVLTAKKKDGSEFHVDISLRPIRVEGKTLIAAFVRELSTNKTMELRFQKMIEDVQDYSILFTDIDGTIINWNKGVLRISGYSEKEIIGQNLRIFHTKEDQENEEPERLLDQAIVDGRVMEEGWRVRKDGTRFWASVTITAIHDELHHFIGFSMVTRDLTDSKEAEELLRKQSQKLEAKNKELEHFAYIASHDLTEPLSTVTSMVDLIKEEKSEQMDEDSQVYFSFIQDAVNRMSKLVKGLLDYSRLGKNGELVHLSVAELLEEVVQDLGTSINTKNAKITIGKMPFTYAYSVELRLLFQNIISNALKFAHEDRPPKIEIRAQEVGSHWKFSISDNGIGIPDKYKEKIFVIFQRLNDQKSYEGAGIGLAHCKKIVELHNGAIWVESTVGLGSTFHFTVDKNPGAPSKPMQEVKPNGELDQLHEELLPMLFSNIK